MIDLSDDTFLTRHDQAIESRLGTETVILHLESGVYFGLDPVGTRIWEILADGATPADIRARMQDEFDVAPEVLRADVQAFLESLLAHEIVRPA